ncbi:ribonuclease D [Cutibacterium acnes JCM 18916]|nr:ribonuclease D [Cutibacterium acnes JCM 18916]
MLARENLAHDLDIMPGRLLRDEALVAAARHCDRTGNVDVETVLAIRGFHRGRAKKSTAKPGPRPSTTHEACHRRSIRRCGSHPQASPTPGRGSAIIRRKPHGGQP